MPGIYSLLYVSRRVGAPEDHDEDVAKIVEVSTTRNVELGITGALVGTPQHFSQILEGGREAVETLMRSIVADPRHTGVAVIETQELPERAFARWSMAHIGPSRELEQIIKQAAARFTDGQLTGAEGWRLRSLIGEMAYTQFRTERYRDWT
jgi:hypothetical protein